VIETPPDGIGSGAEVHLAGAAPGVAAPGVADAGNAKSKNEKS
jgi:hypothetical protein